MIKKRGQAAVTDLFVAIGIFIVLVTVTSVLWNLYQVRLMNNMDHDETVVKAFQVSDILLKTPGEPSNWEQNVLNLGSESALPYIKYIGLVEGDRKVPYDKINALRLDLIGVPPRNITEEDVKKMFHASQYRLGIKITSSDGNEVLLFGRTSGTSKFSVNLGKNVFCQEYFDSDYVPCIIEVIISK